MPVLVNIENVSNCNQVPDPADMRRWLTMAVGQHATQAEISVRIVGIEEAAEFNARYRNKSGPTNVLSFAADLPDFVASDLLGDLLVCAPVVNREACEQGKTADAHWAHILVHGALHLLGYNHIQNAEARVMEALETKILGELGFAPPYAEDGSASPLADNEALHS